MYKLVYYDAGTGGSETLYTGSEKNAKKHLDNFIEKHGLEVKTVSSSHVEFRNGDILRVVSLVPLSAIMLTREQRGYEDDGFDSDTIFT